MHDWKTFEKNNPPICLNIFYTKEKKCSQLTLIQTPKNK